MKLPLRERDATLATLTEAAREAVSGRGSVALVHGDAGIGKSSVVSAVCERLADGVRVLIGRCDDLTTARALGPLRDLVGNVGAGLTRALLDGSDLDELLRELRTELDVSGHGTMLVVEDVHWADDATLDVLRYLARRIHDLPVLLVLTYRDDELSPGHPVRLLLGDLSTVVAANRLHRLPLRPLSRDAVREVSNCGEDGAARLHAATAGNPFFLSEILAGDGTAGVLPPTVVDAVLARVYRLPEPVARCLEALAVIPTAIDRPLAEALLGERLSLLAVAEERGLVSVTPSRISFCHDVSRRSIADALSETRRTELNRRVLATLSGVEGVDSSRLIHHAVQARDHDAIVRFGPRAAREAVRLGAHREAAAFYRLVLEDDAVRLPPDERALLLEEYAAECHTIGTADAAIAAQRDAIELHRRLADKPRLGAGLHRLSSMYWWNGQRLAAEEAVRESIDTLEGTGDTRLLANAYNHQTQLRVLADHHAEASDSAERAVRLARQLDAPDILAAALSNLGCARWSLGHRAEGRAHLEESLHVALSAGEVEQACLASLSLAWRLTDELRLLEARRVLDDAEVLAESTEHFALLGHLRMTRAAILMSLGRWDEALTITEADRHGELAQTQGGFLAIQGWIRVRRGLDGGESLLQRAYTMAWPTGEWQRIGPLAVALAEAAWLRGDLDAVRRHAQAAYEPMLRTGGSQPRAALEYWLAKSGHPVAPFDPEHPYALQMAGRWPEAAAHWREAGQPYEYAMALVDSDSPDHLLTALRVLDEQDARPLARIVRARLRSHGVTRVPRGPAPATRSNPAKLTRRQIEVAGLLARGLTNAQIADHLVLSVRTVDNHVAAVLDKLGAASRRDVRQRAAELNLSLAEAG